MSVINRREFVKMGSLGTLGMLMGCTPSLSFDIILRNALIIDGTGRAGSLGDLGISGSKITALGNLSKARAHTVIDATGKVLTPGFIDIHTHTDSELLVNGLAESKIRQGVTTEVAGNCGSSPFPLLAQDAHEFHAHLQSRYGIETRWTTLDGYFDALSASGISLNYATLTGQGDLRTYVVGRNDTPPAADDIKAMQALLQESMEQGSFGLSTGLEYAPGSYADTRELTELTRVLAPYGGIYATHLRNEDDTVEEAIEEALKIGRDAGVHTQISHLKACNRNNWHKVDHMLEMISAARKDQPVTADRYPYDAWGTGLSAFLPLWARQGDTSEVLGRLKDEATFEQISDYATGRATRIGGWDRVLISSCSEEKDKSCEGLTVLEGARQRGVTPMQFARDLLLNNDNNVGVVGFAMDENNLKKVLAADFVMVGSDGNAVAPYGLLGTGKPHPRYYGTFPRVLGKYARDENIMDLAVAVKKMTSMPAAVLGLKDRGQIQVGYRADLVLLDPERVQDKASFSDPHQYPEGIETVIVNGQMTIHRGEHTGVKAGEILRKT